MNLRYYERLAQGQVMESAVEDNYWFGFRVKDGGSIVLQGPYTYDKAMKERERLKAPDAEVSAWVVADSREEAREKVSSRM